MDWVCLDMPQRLSFPLDACFSYHPSFCTTFPPDTIYCPLLPTTPCCHKVPYILVASQLKLKQGPPAPPCVIETLTLLEHLFTSFVDFYNCHLLCPLGLQHFKGVLPVFFSRAGCLVQLPLGPQSRLSQRLCRSRDGSQFSLALLWLCPGPDTGQEQVPTLPARGTPSLPSLPGLAGSTAFERPSLLWLWSFLQSGERGIIPFTWWLH